MKKLRIAMLASDFIRIPPRPKDIPPGYSGAPEMIISLITENMVKRGHEVTLFASGDSKTRAKLFSLTKKSTGIDPNIGRGKHLDFEFTLISKCYQMANQGMFDIIHSHFDNRTACIAPFTKVPTVVTMHSPIIGNKRRLLKVFPRTQWYVSVSNAQRKSLPSLKYIATIYHGVEVRSCPFYKVAKDYLFISGRIRPEKGVSEAIKVAQKTGKRLLIAGSSIPGEDYFEKKVKPYLNKKINYLGLLKREKAITLVGQAKILIAPLKWEEPFGLMMIEAMAGGTPVIAFKRGSASEIIENGKTGYIVKTVPEMVRAVKKIYSLTKEQYQKMRYNCRKHVEKNFTVEKMIDTYEKVYLKVVKSVRKR